MQTITNIKYQWAIAFTCIFILSPLLSQAQFEGTITYARTNIDEKTRQEKKNGEMELLISPQRILLKGLNNVTNMKLLGTEATKSVLVRQDKQDFVMMTDNARALKVSKQDLQNMSSFMSNFGGTQKNDNSLQIRSTDVTDKINGHTVKKYVLWSTENPLSRIDIWFTEELNVDWGMLSEKWLSDSGSMFVPSFIFDNVFKEHSIPLLIQHYNNDQLISEIESIRIKEGSITAQQTAMPEGLTLIGLQQYMMMKMSGN